MESFAHINKFNADGAIDTKAKKSKSKGYSPTRAAHDLRDTVRKYVAYAGDKIIAHNEIKSRTGKLKSITLVSYEPRIRISEAMPRVYPVSVMSLDCRRFRDNDLTTVAHFSEHALCRIIQREKCQGVADINDVIFPALEELNFHLLQGWECNKEMTLLTRDYFMPLAPGPGEGRGPVVKSYIPRSIWRREQEEYFAPIIPELDSEPGDRCRFLLSVPTRDQRVRRAPMPA